MALLKKISAGDEDEIQSIVDNLNNLLNTKRGWGFFLKDFGISDYNHLHSRDNIAELAIREVSENIERFEPRVKLVKIVDLENDEQFRLSFRIDCMIRENARSLVLFMDPVLERYEVKQ